MEWVFCRARSTRFRLDAPFKVPHIGWNRLQVHQDSALARCIDDDSYAYFVHSYYCQPAQPEDVLFTASYGETFTAGIQRDNIYGVQFHPEKSQGTGLQIIRNFLTL